MSEYKIETGAVKVSAFMVHKSHIFYLLSSRNGSDRAVNQTTLAKLKGKQNWYDLQEQTGHLFVQVSSLP